MSSRVAADTALMNPAHAVGFRNHQTLCTHAGTKSRFNEPVSEAFYNLTCTNETSGFLPSESGDGIGGLPYARLHGDHLADTVHDSSVSHLVLVTSSFRGSGLHAQMCFHLLPSPPFVYSPSTSPKSFLLLPTKMMALSPLFNLALDACVPALLL